MNKVFKFAAVSVALTLVCGGLTSCGKETVNLLDSTDIFFEGYEGYGTATLINDLSLSEIEELYCIGNMSFTELDSFERAFQKAVKYNISQESELSNGDEVTLEIDVNNDLLKAYDLKFKGGKKTFTVSELDEIQEFDPFEGISVIFSGTAPNGKAQITGTSSFPELSLSYTLDKKDGLSNGDTVTVSISAYNTTDVEEYCTQNGKKPTSIEKTFTVSDLTKYITSADEIPEDMANKMIKQAEDTFRSQAASWSEGNSIKNIDLLGYYILSGKPGFSSNGNEIYCVFKITADVQGYSDEKEAEENKNAKELPTNEDTYYTYYRYQNVMLLPDGTCSLDLSAGATPTKTIESKYGVLNWGSLYYHNFKGYSEPDSMFNDCVTSKIDSYNYESTVEGQIKKSAEETTIENTQKETEPIKENAAQEKEDKLIQEKLIVDEKKCLAHLTNCSHVDEIAEEDKKEIEDVYNTLISDLETQGITPCKDCKPW